MGIKQCLYKLSMILCYIFCNQISAVATAPIETKLIASDANTYDWFGQSVAISGDTAIVGAPRNAAAYLYDAVTGAEVRKLTPTRPILYEEFGHSVAISGNRAIIGAPYNGSDYSGAAYIYDATTGKELFRLTASDDTGQDNFGHSVAILGDRAIVGSYHRSSGTSVGAAYIYDVTTGNELFKLTAPDAVRGDLFGYSVAISGDKAVVSSHFDSDRGNSSGAAYIFDATTGSELFKVTASDAGVGDLFGYSLAISGNVAIIGALRDRTLYPDAGSAYLFDVTTGTELRKLVISEPSKQDHYGHSVAIDGDVAIVGQASLQIIGRTPRPGAARLFDVTTGVELMKISASDGGSEDEFSSAVAISGDRIIIGAYRDSDTGQYSGSAYLYQLIIPEPSTSMLLVLACLAGLNVGAYRGRPRLS
jgi:outer membrane protein assembly factor BamB